MLTEVKMERPLMKCGCVAQGVLRARGGETLDPPIPAYVVHECYDVADDKPDLTGRIAQCAYLPKGHAPKPSSYDLAFFEYLGPGSRESSDLCKCGFSKKPHDENGGRIPPKKYAANMKGCAAFTPKGPAEFDRYYCGCHGWD
jgi:hypothetical protein